MDTRSIDVTRQRAGAEYLSALERLGLTPNALFWAFDKTLQKFVLVLVTDAIDFAGPYEMSKALIEAYRKSATPAEIDPLIVRVHSPNQTVIKELVKALAFTALDISGASDRPFVSDGSPLAEVKVDVADVEVSSKWIYLFQMHKVSHAVGAARRWRRFAENVHRIAA